MSNRYDMPPELRVEASDGVCVVTLNRPEQYNAVNEPLHSALAEVWRHVENDPDVRAVVLTGAGQAFSGGGDISWFSDIAEDPVLRGQILREARDVVSAMSNLTVPLVAAVNGPAVGLGCSISVLADVVLMSRTAYLSDPHVAVGLVAGDGGAVSWPLMTSILRAKEYILLGDRIPAEEAERIGLANHVVEPDQLMTRAMDLAKRFAALPPQAVRNTKRAINLHLIDAANRVLDFALAAEGESFSTPEHQQIVAKLLSHKG